MASLPKLLTTREMELFRAAVCAQRRFILDIKADQPNVMQQAAADIIEGLSFKIDEDDVAEVCEEVTGS